MDPSCSAPTVPAAGLHCQQISKPDRRRSAATAPGSGRRLPHCGADRPPTRGAGGHSHGGSEGSAPERTRRSAPLDRPVSQSKSCAELPSIRATGVPASAVAKPESSDVIAIDGQPGLALRIVKTSPKSAAVISCGTSSNRAPRSTWCITTSRRRSQGTSAAETIRPWAVRTCWCQLSSESAWDASANALHVSRTSLTMAAGGRVAPRTMAASRSAGEPYIGDSIPVRAQRSRLPSASALRAMWDKRWPRDQPGSELGWVRSCGGERLGRLE